MDQDADLAIRIRAIEDERSILQTLYRYAHAIDYGDDEGYVNCFTSDGVFEVRSRLAEPSSKRIEGSAELRAFIARHSRAPDAWHKHMVWQPLIDVVGDEATCTSYGLALVEHEGTPVIKVFGRYRDELVRGDDGSWRFRLRLFEVESAAPGTPKLAYFVDTDADLPSERR